jgi:hypothetical protein
MPYAGLVGTPCTTLRRRSRFRTVGIEHHQTDALLLLWANRASQRPHTDTAAATNQQARRPSNSAPAALLLSASAPAKREPQPGGRIGERLPGQGLHGSRSLVNTVYDLTARGAGLNVHTGRAAAIETTTASRRARVRDLRRPSRVREGADFRADSRRPRLRPSLGSGGRPRYERRLLRPVRISLIRISGCSRAAKCPPLLASL